jgi:hypothetical protein
MSDRAINARSSRLRNLFAKVLSGKQGITDANTSLFLEAICDQSDPATCIQRLINSGHGFLALQSALRINTSSTFLNGPLPSFLRYLQAPELKSICGGDVLRRKLSSPRTPGMPSSRLSNRTRSTRIVSMGSRGSSYSLSLYRSNRRLRISRLSNDSLSLHNLTFAQ